MIVRRVSSGFPMWLYEVCTVTPFISWSAQPLLVSIWLAAPVSILTFDSSSDFLLEFPFFAVSSHNVLLFWYKWKKGFSLFQEQSAFVVEFPNRSVQPVITLCPLIDLYSSPCVPSLELLYWSRFPFSKLPGVHYQGVTTVWWKDVALRLAC